MAEKNKIPPAVGDRALEMVMREVLDSMEEMSLEAGLSPLDGGFEIIDIAPERHTIRTPEPEIAEDTGEEAEVIEFQPLRRAAS